jgi:hypothetical protein
MFVQTNDGGTYSVLVTNIAGSILSSNAVLTVTPSQGLKFDLVALLPNGQVRLVLRGEPGNYSVQTASNLADWVPWTNVSISNTPIELIDTSAPGTSSRFYRAFQP